MKFREVYLDTTYLMPFFYLDIDVKGFSRSVYKEVIKSFARIHVSEISIIEAKAKSLKIGRKLTKVNKEPCGKPQGINVHIPTTAAATLWQATGYPQDEKFNEGLSVLSADEKVVIHGYKSEDDKKFNEFLPLGLGFFDAVILAQSSTVGNLLTEDSRLLRLEDIGVKIINWDTLLREMGIGNK